jgi:hypothetical protein
VSPKTIVSSRKVAFTVLVAIPLKQFSGFGTAIADHFFRVDD